MTKSILKKIILLTLVLIATIAVIQVNAAQSRCCLDEVGRGEEIRTYTVKKQGHIKYHVIDNEVHIIHIDLPKNYKKNSFKIPSKIKGKKVTVLENRYYYHKDPGCMIIVKKLIIPKTVRVIGYYSCSGVDEIVFEKKSNLKRIETSAFDDNRNLRKIKLPESLRYIGAGAFYRTGLKGEVVIPDKVKEIGGVAFSHTNITSIKLPKNLKIIGHQAFYKCKSLKTIKLPNGLEKIDSAAFAACKKLKTIKLPKSLKSVAVTIFKDTNVKDLYIGENVEEITDYGYYDIGLNIVVNPKNKYFTMVNHALYNKEKTILYKKYQKEGENSFTAEESVEVIDEEAFWQINNLDIYLGKNVKEIKDPSLFYSKNSKYIISDENPNFKTVDGILFNKDMTVLLGFPNTTEITTYTLPKGVKRIAEKAMVFFEKTTLKEIILNEDLESIENGNFCFWGNLDKEGMITVYASKEIVESHSTRFGEVNWLTLEERVA